MPSTTVNFSIKNANDAPFADQTLTFKLLTTGADASGDYVVLPSSTTGTTASDGTGSVTLFTNGDSDIDSLYEVLFPNGEKLQFIIPSGTTSISLADLITTHQPTGSTAQQSSVYSDAIKRSNHTGVQPLSSIDATDRDTIQLKPSEGAFDDGDKTKLDGIESSATADQTDEEIQDIVGSMLTGNTETGITVTYQDADGTIDFSVASQTDENFTSALKTKLDGIPSSGGSITDEEIEDVVGGMLAGNTETGINVTYDDSDGTIDFIVASQTDENFTTADHTKLDGIETNATADQTDEEIQDVVGAMLTGNSETGISATYDDTNGKIDLSVASQTDENFTTALKTKLDGISAGAGASVSTEDVEDIVGGMLTGNFESGIAVSYDDTNGIIDFVVASQTDQNFTNADHTKLNGIETSATADQTDAEIRAAVEAASDSNVFTDADHAKLNSLPNAFVRRSISFGSSSSYIRAYNVIGGSADNTSANVGTGDFSLSFFAKLNSSNTEPIISKISGTGYRLKFSSGNLILTMQDSNDSADYNLASGLNDGKWHTYVVSVERSGNATAYVDNVAQDPEIVSGSAGTLDNTAEFRLGYDGINAADGVALGNYVTLTKLAFDADEAAKIYFSPDAAPLVEDCEVMLDLRRADETFSDLGVNAMTVASAGTIVFNEPRLTSLSGTNIGYPNPASYVTGSVITGTDVVVGQTVEGITGIGYTSSTGTGGSVIQQTSKSTLVELDKPCGEIVMHGEEMLDGDVVNFTLDSNLIIEGSVVIVNVGSAATLGAYLVTVGAVSNGSCNITVTNVSGSPLSEAIKLNFALITAVSS